MWRYRVIKHKQTPSDAYCIHEAYCECEKDSAQECKPDSITSNPIEPYGDTLEELKKDLEKMLEAFKYPVLNFEDF